MPIALARKQMPLLRRVRRSVVSSWSPLALVPLVWACGGSTNGGETGGDASSVVFFPRADAGVDVATSVDASTVKKPVDASGITAVPLSTCVPAQYTAPVTIGGTQNFQMVVDTGSTTLGVASATCGSSCNVSPEYTPGTTATDQHQPAYSQYGTGSWSGEIFQDSVTVGPSVSTSVALVAIDSQSQFFTPGTFCDSKEPGLQGILGFGPGGAALPGTNAFFDQLVAATGIPNIFATELCDTSGTLWLGGYDPTFATAAPQYTSSASIYSDSYYAVGFTSVTVNGTTVPVATAQYGASLVDTGTNSFILPTSTFTAMTSAIAATTGFQTVFGYTTASSAAGWFTGNNPCTQLSQTKAELDATLPPLTLTFGTPPNAISVQAAPTESYLMQFQGMWCSAMQPMDPGTEFPFASVMGAPVLKSNIVIFDRENQQIGFAPHKACP